MDHRIAVQRRWRTVARTYVCILRYPIGAIMHQNIVLGHRLSLLFSQFLRVMDHRIAVQRRWRTVARTYVCILRYPIGAIMHHNGTESVAMVGTHDCVSVQGIQ